MQSFHFCQDGSVALETPDMDLTDMSGSEEVSISIEGYLATSVEDAYRALEDGQGLGVLTTRCVRRYLSVI